MSAVERPNILLIITDQQRHDWVGTNSDVPVRTPNYDTLADRGVEFTNAVCPSPLCGPSRACLAGGMEYGRSGVQWNDDFPLETPTYYRRLRDEGDYTVFGVGDIDLHMNTPSWGLDGTNLLGEQGFTGGVEIPGKYAMQWTYREDLTEAIELPGSLPADIDPAPNRPANAYMAYLAEEGLLDAYVSDQEQRDSFGTTAPAPIPHHAYVDNWVGRRAFEYLEEAPTDRPWHTAVNFVGPHAPVDVTEEMHGWYRDPDVKFPPPVNPDDRFDNDHHQEIRRNYATIIENIDRWLGRYVELLRDRGQLEETIVVFASDHGEHLGDNGTWSKHSPRHQSVGVPLALAGPGVASRPPVESPATILDLHATFLDYAGIDPGPVDSRSMVSFLADGSGPPRSVVRSGLRPWRMVFDGRYKLVVGYDNDADPRLTGAFSKAYEGDYAAAVLYRRQSDPLLFDLESDPEETTNVAADHPTVVRRLSRHLPLAGVDR